MAWLQIQIWWSSRKGTMVLERFTEYSGLKEKAAILSTEKKKLC